MLGFPSNKLGIDLGSSNIRIFNSRTGEIIEIPSYIAINNKFDSITEIGERAKNMYGRPSKEIKTYKLIQRGVIVHQKQLEFLLKKVINKILGGFKFIRPEILVTAPSYISNLEERVINDIFSNIGTKEVHIGRSSIFAGFGAGINLSELKGRMIIDIGESKTEASIISLGTLVKTINVMLGGGDMDKAIVEFLKHNYKIEISETVASKIKRKYGNAINIASDENFKLNGLDITTHLPKVVSVKISDINISIAPILNKIIAEISAIFDEVSPEIITDIIQHGVLLTGGVANLKSLDNLIQTKLQIKVISIDKPELSVINGIAKLIEIGHVDSHKKYLNSAQA